jgi:hypothetical protein
MATKKKSAAKGKTKGSGSAAGFGTTPPRSPFRKGKP